MSSTFYCRHLAEVLRDWRGQVSQCSSALKSQSCWKASCSLWDAPRALRVSSSIHHPFWLSNDTGTQGGQHTAALLFSFFWTYDPSCSHPQAWPGVSQRAYTSPCPLSPIAVRLLKVTLHHGCHVWDVHLVLPLNMRVLRKIHGGWNSKTYKIDDPRPAVWTSWNLLKGLRATWDFADEKLNLWISSVAIVLCSATWTCPFCPSELMFHRLCLAKSVPTVTVAKT